MDKKEWYKFDYQKRQFVLTDKAPQSAKDSYKEYLESLKMAKEKGHRA
jgi:hypothetical protein